MSFNVLGPFRNVLACASLMLAVAGVSPAFATTTDSQTWTSLTVVKTITPKLEASVELHARLIEDSDTMGQRLFRPALTYKINDRFSVAAGYFYGLFNTSTSESFHEQRLWQQVGYTFMRGENGFHFSGRTRLEERFIESNDETGFRLRQQFRLDTPYLTDGKMRGVLWNETFIGLNDTSWGQRSDLDQTRTFIGVNLPLTEHIALEPGYLNQLSFRRGENAINHVAAINVIARF